MVNQYCAHYFARNWQLPFLNIYICILDTTFHQKQSSFVVCHKWWHLAFRFKDKMIICLSKLATFYDFKHLKHVKCLDLLKGISQPKFWYQKMSIFVSFMAKIWQNSLYFKGRTSCQLWLVCFKENTLLKQVPCDKQWDLKISTIP